METLTEITELLNSGQVITKDKFLEIYFNVVNGYNAENMKCLNQYIVDKIDLHQFKSIENKPNSFLVRLIELEMILEEENNTIEESLFTWIYDVYEELV